MTRHSSVAFEDTETWSPSQAAGRPISSFDIKRIIVLRLPAFLITTTIALVVLVPLAWFLTPVNYTAVAEIRFLSVRPRIMDTESSASIAGSYEKFVSTQAALISGNTILQRVLNDPQVSTLPQVMQAPDRLAFLQEHVRARQKSGTELVQLECSLPDREAARTILDVVKDEYLDYALGQEAYAGGERLRILVTERDSRQKDLELLLDQVNTLQAKLGPIADGATTPGTSEIGLYRESLVRAEEDHSRLRLELSTLEDQVARANEMADSYSAESGDRMESGDIERSVDADPRVAALTQELARAKSELAMMSARYKEGQLAVEKQKQTIAAIESQIAATKPIVRKEMLYAKAKALEEEAEVLRGKVAEADQRVTKYKQQLDDSAKRMEAQSGDYASLQDLISRVDERRTLIAELSKQITDLGLESKAPAQVSLASDVTVPASPGIAAKLASVLLAAAASFGIGFAVAASKELMDHKLRTSDDIARITNVPVIAKIPHTSEDLWLKGSQPFLLTDEHVHSATADQLRRILTSVVYPTEESAWVNSILFTSPTRGDGKTTLACSLSVALAQANRRVLLVDLSHRRPDVESRFDLEPADGLLEILTGQRTFDEVVRETRVPNLYVLGPGRGTEGLAHWLVSQQMVQFQAFAEENFTHVVFDTPPALLMSDASLLAPRVDGVILVVGVDTSNRGMVLRCLQDMERIGAVTLGVVLNGIRSMRGGYLKEHYDLHYNYAGHGRTKEDPVEPASH